MSLIDVQIIELFGLDKGHFIIGDENEINFNARSNRKITSENARR